MTIPPPSCNPRAVALCADDYGLAPGLGVAIRALLAAGRLGGTGCMVSGPHWPAEAALLRALAAHGAPAFDAGLHLTLTDQPAAVPSSALAPAGTLPPLGRLLALALTRRLDTRAVAAEMERQLDLFEAAWGAPPAYVDGHHHVHQLPGVRDALLDLYDRRLRRHGTVVRYCTRSAAGIVRAGVAVPRALLIAALGWRFSRAGRLARVPGNDAFAGVRTFIGEKPFAELMRAWLEGAPPRTLVMCHPGLVDDALTAADGLTDAREEEYRFLAGPAFPALLAETNRTVVAPSRL